MSTNIWVVDWREFHPTLAVPSKPSIFAFVYGDFIQSKLLSNLELGAQKKTDKALTVPSSTFFEQFSSDSKTWLWKTVHKNWQFHFWSISKIPNVRIPMQNCYSAARSSCECFAVFVLVRKGENKVCSTSKLHFMTLVFSGFQANSRIFDIPIW